MTALVLWACSVGSEPVTDTTEVSCEGQEIEGNGLDDDCDGFEDEFGERGRLASEGSVLFAGDPGNRIGGRLTTGLDADGRTWLVADGAGLVFAAVEPGGPMMRLGSTHGDTYIDAFGDAIAVGAFDGGLDAPVVVSNPDRGFVGLFSLLGGHTEDLPTTVISWTGESIGGHLQPSLRAGDVDGDDFDELVVPSPVGVLVMDGPVTQTTWDNERLRIENATTQNLGHTMCDVADLTGDGVAEIGLSSQEAGGRIWLVSGDATGTAPLQDLQIASVAGEPPDHDAGNMSCTAGDANDDGHHDLLMGAPAVSSAYLMLGPFAGQRSLADADAHVISGWEGDVCGSLVSFLRADGGDHLLVHCGGVIDRVEVFRGAATTGTMDAAEAEIVFVGGAWGVAGKHDLTGDGVPDLAIGVPGDSSAAPDGGVVYLFEGPLL